MRSLTFTLLLVISVQSYRHYPSFPVTANYSTTLKCCTSITLRDGKGQGITTKLVFNKTTYSFDGDGLRRSVATNDLGQDPPTLVLATMVWDGSDYLLLSEPTGNRVVLTLDSEIVACATKDLLTDPLGSLGNLKNEVSQRSLKWGSRFETI